MRRELTYNTETETLTLAPASSFPMGSDQIQLLETKKKIAKIQHQINKTNYEIFDLQKIFSFKWNNINEYKFQFTVGNIFSRKFTFRQKKKSKPC